MSNQTQKLIDAVREKRGAGVQAAFESIMAEKTAAAIDAKRAVVVDSTFNQTK
jgi:hypothetical protein